MKVAHGIFGDPQGEARPAAMAASLLPSRQKVGVGLGSCRGHATKRDVGFSRAPRRSDAEKILWPRSSS